jgi:hypothetical protein
MIIPMTLDIRACPRTSLKILEKMSITDEDSRLMKIHGQVELCYNGQCATENQVILAYDVNREKVADKNR